MIKEIKRIIEMKPPKTTESSIKAIFILMLFMMSLIPLLYHEVYPFTIIYDIDNLDFLLAIISIGAIISTFVVIWDNPHYFSVKGMKKDYMIRLLLFLVALVIVSQVIRAIMDYLFFT